MGKTVTVLEKTDDIVTVKKADDIATVKDDIENNQLWKAIYDLQNDNIKLRQEIQFLWNIL